MEEGQREDTRGTFWDWPMRLVVAGVLLFVVAAANGATGLTVIGLLLGVFGLVAWLARRGTFSPRRR